MSCTGKILCIIYCKNRQYKGYIECRTMCKDMEEANPPYHHEMSGTGFAESLIM